MGILSLEGHTKELKNVEWMTSKAQFNLCHIKQTLANNVDVIF